MARLPKWLVLPLLRVFVRDDGRIVFNHRRGAQPPVDEGWWRDVLHDPRAQWPRQQSIERDSPLAFYRLDRQRPDILIRCPCGREEWMDRDKLIGEVGGSTNVIYLAREWMPCKERNKVANHCRAYVAR